MFTLYLDRGEWPREVLATAQNQDQAIALGKMYSYLRAAPVIASKPIA